MDALNASAAEVWEEREVDIKIVNYIVSTFQYYAREILK